MAVAPPLYTPPASSAPIASGVPSAALLRLVTGMTSLPTVRKVKAANSIGRIELWALLDSHSDEVAEHIYELEREFLRSGEAVLVEVHVVPLSEVDERNLPSAETLFER